MLVVGCLVLGVIAGFVRSPTYTAETRLIVGKAVQLNNLAATPGLSAASTDLAVTYSRLLSTPSVYANAQKRAGSAGVGGGVSATPIAQSPVVRVEGTGTTPEMASAQANAGAEAIVKAVNEVNAAQDAFSKDLLKRYQTADAQLVKDTRSLQLLQQQLAANPENTLLQDQVVTAQTQVDSDTLRLNTLATQYQASISPQDVDTQIVQQLGKAVDTGNNRKTSMEIGAIVGLVVGGLLALGVTMMIDRRSSSLRVVEASADGDVA